MPNNPLQQLGLSKNEAEIYQALLEDGGSSVTIISKATGINRRNIYDVLNRLMEKGLVFEILKKGETIYNAVSPKKLTEFIDEEKRALASIMPNLQKLYTSKPTKEEIMIYQGIEGVKRYMRDILRVGENVHSIGITGAWRDERLKPSLEYFKKEGNKKGINQFLIFDPKAAQYIQEIIGDIPLTHYRILPMEFAAQATVEVFGDHCVFLSGNSFKEAGKSFTITVIINQQIADSFRAWFKLIWSLCKDPKTLHTP
jgi:sugar-specific transcriptional regulator TrmB